MLYFQMHTSGKIVAKKSIAFQHAQGLIRQETAKVALFNLLLVFIIDTEHAGMFDNQIIADLSRSLSVKHRTDQHAENAAYKIGCFSQWMYFSALYVFAVPASEQSLENFLSPSKNLYDGKCPGLSYISSKSISNGGQSCFSAP